MSDPTPDAALDDPRHAIRLRLLQFGDAVRRARREVDAHRQAVAAFERLDELGPDSRAVTSMAELAEVALDSVVRTIEEVGARLAGAALDDARRTRPPLPTGEEPKP